VLGRRRLVEEPAVVDALAVAAGRGLQPGADTLRAVDQRVDLGQLPYRQLAQLVRHRRGAVLNEQADLVQAHAGALSDVDHRESPQHTLVVASLPTDPLWFWQQPDVLVVTDQRGLHACAPGDVADAQSGSLHHPNPSS
jgi:hypothetical protein